MLSGSNTFTGDLTISSGLVDVDGTLAPEVDVINQGTLNVNAANTIASLSGFGDVNIASGITLTTDATNNFSFAGSFLRRWLPPQSRHLNSHPHR